MQDMLAYTVQSNINPGAPSYVCIGFGSTGTTFRIPRGVEDSYWILILDCMNPRNKVKEFVFPGQDNTAVPAGLDDYMKNPQYYFAVVTQSLVSMHVPQGDFYDYLAKYGASRELQRLEQLHSVFPSCGNLGRMSYILTGQGGPRDPDPVTKKVTFTAPSYELSSLHEWPAQLLMSLMPRVDASGRSAPPYSICNSYTFKTR
jgi:hypothetical protein